MKRDKTIVVGALQIICLLTAHASETATDRAAHSLHVRSSAVAENFEAGRQEASGFLNAKLSPQKQYERSKETIEATREVTHLVAVFITATRRSFPFSRASMSTVNSTNCHHIDKRCLPIARTTARKPTTASKRSVSERVRAIDRA